MRHVNYMKEKEANEFFPDVRVVAGRVGRAYVELAGRWLAEAVGEVFLGDVLHGESPLRELHVLVELHLRGLERVLYELLLRWKGSTRSEPQGQDLSSWCIKEAGCTYLVHATPYIHL